MDMIRSAPPIFTIIITDSKEIVNKYILKNYYNKNNFVFIDANLIDSFYLYYNAKHIVMSNTTFSIAGSYFNMSKNININNINIKIPIYYLLYRDKNSKNSLPYEKAISDQWHIISERKYILNYNLSLNLEIHNFLNIYKRNIYKEKLLSNNNNLSNTNNLPFIYKNKINIDYNEYLYKLKIKNNSNYFYNTNKPQNPYAINKFYEEIYFDKILNENNIKSCIFITKNMWNSYFIRLFQYNNLNVFTLYINEHDNSGYDIHKPLIYYINKDIQKYESLILFLIKNDYGVEFDFIYDYYMFKINEYLNTVKNLKLLIIVYEPNLILPFTLNTLINICNHSENYKIININNYIYIIFNNIKNYNIDVINLKLNFNYLYKTIIYLTNEDILKEIAYSQSKTNSIGSSYLFNFNNITNKKEKENEKYIYKINIINYPININNDSNKFKFDLLLNIYKLYDYDKYYLNLFLPENFIKKE
jgi:hypothetical protein